VTQDNFYLDVSTIGKQKTKEGQMFFNQSFQFFREPRKGDYPTNTQQVR
jgi:hypothetical protein